MVSATDGSAFTGSVTVSVTIDAGVQATGSVASGACTHEGNGYHTYAPAQAETNGALIAFTFTGTGAVPATVQVYTIAGDSFTRLGAPAGASISADLLAIDNFVDGLEATIGAAGAGLTAVPWNAAWDAEVQSEVDDALVVQRLDELLNADSDIDGAAPPTVGSVVHELLTKTAGSFTYDQTTDSLEAVRDNMGTAQTGDSFARLGAPAGASVSADLLVIDNFVDGLETTIGAAGAGLTALATQASVDALVTTVGAAGAGLTAINLPNQTMDIIGNITGNLSGSVGSVTGAVGSVTGAVGSIAAGGIATTSFAAGAIDAAAIAANAIGASELAADAVAEIADGVWDEATAGHTTAASYGDKLGAHLPAILKVVVGVGSTTTAIVLNATTGIDGAAPSAINDYYNGRVLVLTSGALAGQATSIADYVGATVTLTVVALTGAPAAAVTGVIV